MQIMQENNTFTPSPHPPHPPKIFENLTLLTIVKNRQVSRTIANKDFSGWAKIYVEILGNNH